MTKNTKLSGTCRKTLSSVVTMKIWWNLSSRWKLNLGSKAPLIAWSTHLPVTASKTLLDLISWFRNRFSRIKCNDRTCGGFLHSRITVTRLGLHAKKYKNMYLICIFLNRFIYSVHIIQVFYNILRKEDVFVRHCFRRVWYETWLLTQNDYLITAKNIHKLDIWFLCQRCNMHRHKIDDDAFRNYLWVKVFDDNVSAIIKSHCIFHLSVF